MSLFSPFVEVFRYTLQPIPPFTWFGLQISTLDVVATIRLCLVLRQIRDQLYNQHVSTKGPENLEEQSFLRSLFTTFTVVYGGEVLTGVYAPSIAPRPLLTTPQPHSWGSRHLSWSPAGSQLFTLSSRPSSISSLLSQRPLPISSSHSPSSMASRVPSFFATSSLRQ